MNPFNRIVTFYRIAGEENCTHRDYIHTSGATCFNSKRIAIFRFEVTPSQKKAFFVAKTIFRLEMRFLYWKRDFYIGNAIFRLETRFLDWKQDF